MGELAARTIFSNDTGPLAGTGLDTLAKNQGAILELEGAQAPQSKTITDGSISPTAAYVIVDTEGSAAADDLDVINPVLSASENLHDGMVIYLKAADSGRVVTVKNSSSANGINTYDGNDYMLSPTHWLKLQLRSGKWYEVEGRAMVAALAAATAAATAATAADHATTKSGASSTASGTAAKVVTCSGFELSTNARVVVTFSNANTVADALTLNVNGTGAKAVYNQTGIISTSNTALFAANQPVEFRYDGTGWVFYDAAKAVSSGTYAASSITAAATSAKVADCAGFALQNQARVFVTFSNINTVSGVLTLNVNGTGAKPIYNERGAVSSTNAASWMTGIPIEFVYDGNYWRYQTVDAVGNAIGLYFYARDEKASGTAGGSSTSAAWNTRDINTVKSNNIGATLTSNRVTLPAGNYYIRANASFFATQGTKLSIYDTTHSQFVTDGVSMFGGNYENKIATTEGAVSFTSQTTIELRMYTAGSNSQSYGVAASTGTNEIFAEIRIWKM